MNRKWPAGRGESGNGIKLLIIDDDPVMTAIYSRCFEDEKFTVEIANDSITGTVLLQTFGPDVVLLDLNMPMRDGMEWLHRIRDNDRYKQLPVVILTGQSPESPQVQEAQRSDATGVMFKSQWNPQTVVAAVKWAASAREMAARAAH
jgi:two-component system chemotaxis response regulator CheY